MTTGQPPKETESIISADCVVSFTAMTYGDKIFEYCMSEHSLTKKTVT